MLSNTPNNPVIYNPDGQVGYVNEYIFDCPIHIISGSFNPLHAGHLAIAERIEEVYGKTAHFEISMCHAGGKPDLTDEEVETRARQFAWKHPLIVTHAATFYEKFRVLSATDIARRVVFHIGADVFVKMDEQARDELLGEPANAINNHILGLRTMSVCSIQNVQFQVYPRPGTEIPEKSEDRYGNVKLVRGWEGTSLSSTQIRLDKSVNPANRWR